MVKESHKRKYEALPMRACFEVTVEFEVFSGSKNMDWKRNIIK
jgi:hypothetical protein